MLGHAFMCATFIVVHAHLAHHGLGFFAGKAVPMADAAKKTDRAKWMVLKRLMETP
jgi:hypothetical protein